MEKMKLNNFTNNNVKNEVNINKNLKIPINKKIISLILMIILGVLISTISIAIPNTLTLQGKLTNLVGASQQGTYNFTFRIYDAFTGGNNLWELSNYNITTDSNGVYDVILTGINLTFADQYYLGITISTDGESTPRVNLTSSPYSFRANTSEALNPNQSYTVTNLSITGNATIGTGLTTLSINTITFNATTTGNISIAGNLTANAVFANNLSGRLSCSNIIGSPDGDFCTDSTGSGTETTNNSAINVTDIIARQGINATQDINTTKGSFYWLGSALQDIFVRATDTFNRANLTDFFGSDIDINNTLLRRTNTSFFATFWSVANTSSYLGGSDVNATLIKTGNLTTLNTLDLYIRVKDFNTANISNSTVRNDSDVRFRYGNFTQNVTVIGNISAQSIYLTGTLYDNGTLNRSIDLSSYNKSLDLKDYQKSSDFNLGNISNNTLTKDNNASIALWNVTSTRVIAPSYAEVINLSGRNLTGANNISATRFTGAINCGMIDGGSDSDFCADASSGVDTSVFNNVNLTSFFGNASINNSIIRETNHSFLNQFMRSADFNLGNISNNTLKVGDNASSSLWNRTGTSTFLRSINDNVGIGTPVPNNRLTIVGNDADSGSATPGLLHLNLTDNYNNTLLPLLTLDHVLANPSNVSTGAGQPSNLGLGILFRATNNDSEIINVSLINATLVNGFNGTEGSALSFSTITNGGQLTPRLVLNGTNVFIAPNSGNVGIGTTEPEDKLHIIDGSAGTVTANADAQLIVEDSGHAFIQILSGGTSQGGILFGDAAATAQSQIYYDHNANKLHITTDNTATAALTIDSSRNVGIGTTAPGRLLEVAGSINGTQLNISGSANLAYGSGLVGIGTSAPVDTLTVVGSVSTFGTLNATRINATTILQGGNAVQLSKDFNLGNISNYTQYLVRADAFTLGNLTGFFGEATINSSLFRANKTAYSLSKIADETISAGTNTMQDDDELYFDINANEKWIFDLKVWAISSPDITLMMNITGSDVPQDVANCTYALVDDSGVSTPAVGCAREIAYTTPTTLEMIQISGSVNTTTAGRVGLWWRQTLGGAGVGSTIKGGSTLKAFKAQR